MLKAGEFAVAVTARLWRKSPSVCYLSPGSSYPPVPKRKVRTESWTMRVTLIEWVGKGFVQEIEEDELRMLARLTKPTVVLISEGQYGKVVLKLSKDLPFELYGARQIVPLMDPHQETSYPEDLDGGIPYERKV